MTTYNHGEHRQLHRLPASVNEVVEQRLGEIVCDCYRCACGGVQAWTIDRNGFVQVRHVEKGATA